jgi:myo-inositol 2-dehydrogenase/D-chiro-inositol 1-dehydrogenase
MRLALLGLDETTLALVRAAQATGKDQIVLACEVNRSNPWAADLPRLADLAEPWETLYELAANGARICDAALVARDANEDARLEQLRKLVQEGIPLLVSHPVHSSMLAYYELDMIRRDTAAIILPCLPYRRHPLVMRLRNWMLESGDAQNSFDQIALEHAMRDRSRSNVSARFARDIDLLRFLAGDISRLGAMGSPGADSNGNPLAYGNLSVQMAGAGSALVRWSVAPLEEVAGARISLTGEQVKAVLTLPDAIDARAELSLRTGASTTTESTVWNPHAAALDDLRAALSGAAESRWPDAAKSVELAETIARSLAKGRTIELHQEEFSDISTFKGTMTSLGCGLLLLALVLIVVGAAAANLLRRAGAHQAAELVSLLPYFLVALFAIFLGAQVVLKLVSRRDD